MSFIRRHTRFLLVGVSCAALGAAASVLATAGAASTGSASTGSGQTVAAGKTKALRMRPFRVQRLRRVAMRAVHGTVVVQTKKGFADVTFDRGKVDSVNGQHLTLTEGTKVARYRTVTLTIPAGAAVRDDRTAGEPLQRQGGTAGAGGGRAQPDVRDRPHAEVRLVLH